MEILFVTSNKGKVEWAKDRLKKFNIELIQKSISLEEPRCIAVEDIAAFKAQKVAETVKEPFIIEDSSFCIETLNNFPATHINLVLKTIGINGICKLMKDEPNRNVNFKSALIFKDGNTQKIFICNDGGILADSPRGNNLHNFNDLFRIFIPKGFNKTLAEMSDLEYSQYEQKIESQDHYVQFAKWLNEKYK